MTGCTDHLNPCETSMAISTVRSKLFTCEKWMLEILPDAASWLCDRNDSNGYDGSIRRRYSISTSSKPKKCHFTATGRSGQELVSVCSALTAFLLVNFDLPNSVASESPASLQSAPSQLKGKRHGLLQTVSQLKPRLEVHRPQNAPSHFQK